MLTSMLFNPLGGGGGGSSPSVVSLDAPITSGDTKAQHAYGVDRMVQGYTGDTIRVERTSDSAQSDFGFSSSTGIFDIDAVITWAAGSTVNVVTLYDQKGSLDLTVTGTANLVTSGAVKRFGTTRSSTDDQLTRSATNGGVGIDMGGNSYFSSGATKTNFDSSTGFEVTMLWSQNTRKTLEASIIPEGLGGNNDKENLFYLDPDGSAFMRQRLCANTTSTDFISLTTSNSSEAENGVFPYKKFSQSIASYSVQPTELILYRNGGADTEALNSTVQSDIAAGDFDESVVYIGHTVSSMYPDILFGGFILSQAYTAAERFLVHNKLNAIGQQHQMQSAEDTLALFDEFVLLTDINTGTEQVTGKNNKLTLDFGTASNNWDYSYSEPIVGLTGIRNPTKNTTVNGFKATTTYFAEQATGSIFSMHISEDSFDPIAGGELVQVISQATGPEVENESTDMSLSLGYDHNEYSMRTEIAGTLDNDSLIGTRRKADETLFGTISYDGANQAMGKYNRSVAHADFIYDETIDSYVWSESAWKNEDPSVPYELDAPVIAPCADNLQYTGKDLHFAVQFGTFKKGENYNLTDPYSTRKQYRLTGTTKSYLSDGSSPIGHRDGSVAINNHASVVHSNANAYIQSHQDSTNIEIKPLYGTRFAFGFATTDWTEDQMEKIQVNVYKLLELE